MSLRQLAQEAGISRATLSKWRAEARAKGQLLPDAKAGPEDWSSRDKHAAVIETAALLTLRKKAAAIWGEGEDE